MKDAGQAGDAGLSFVEKGGVWVVAQFIAMACWLVLPPIAGSITDSVLLWVLSALLLTTGAVLGVLGVRELGQSRTPFPRPPEHTQLAQSGVYAVVRHPLYSSLIALSLGWACLWGSALGAVLALVQAILLDAKARREERWLRDRFPSYPEYARKVRRLIPWVY